MALGITILPRLLLALLVTRSQIEGPASRNECATCHLRLAWTQSEVTHVDQWVTSRHALYRIGCERCHRGDARTSDWTVAHRGVAKSIKLRQSDGAARDVRPMSRVRGQRVRAERPSGTAIAGRGHRPDLHLVSHVDGKRCSVPGGIRTAMPALPWHRSAESRASRETAARGRGDAADRAATYQTGDRRDSERRSTHGADGAMGRCRPLPARRSGRSARVRSAACGRPAE